MSKSIAKSIVINKVASIVAEIGKGDKTNMLKLASQFEGLSEYIGFMPKLATDVSEKQVLASKAGDDLLKSFFAKNYNLFEEFEKSNKKEEKPVKKANKKSKKDKAEKPEIKVEKPVENAAE